MPPSKKTNDKQPVEVAQTALAVEAPMLPAVIGATAKELEANLVPAVTPLIAAMPTDLGVLLQKRFVTPAMNQEDALPGMGNQKGISVSWIKVVNPLTQNKTFRGQRLHDGTVSGKSVLYVPGETEHGLPFIVLGAWEERLLGKWDTKKSSMDTRCQSRDGVSPAQKNDWGALKCKDCQFDVRNRPKWEIEKAKGTDGDRCKKKMNLIGIGGDFEDLYVLQVSGKAIVDFYSKGIVKQLTEAQNSGLPRYARTFILRTVADGTFWTWQLEDVLDTVTPPGFPDNGTAFWSGLSPSQVELTMATLKLLQTMAKKYVSERQDAALEAMAFQARTGERVILPDEGDDAPVPESAAKGLD